MTGEMGYDAIGLGERDLNYGLPFLKEMMETHNLPFINANVRDAGTGELILPEYTIVERNGIRYGIVSVLDPRHKIITMTADDANFQVDDPVAVMRDLLPRLRKEADTILLLSHLGEQKTTELIKEVNGIDMCVIGHTSRNISAERIVNDTALFSSAFEGRYIGRANLFVDDGDGRVMAIDVGITSLGEKMDGDEAMAARVEQYKKDLIEFKTAKRAAYPRTMGSDKETFLGDRACMSCHEDAWNVYMDSSHRSAFASIRNKGQSFAVQQAGQRPVRGLPWLRQPARARRQVGCPGQGFLHHVSRPEKQSGIRLCGLLGKDQTLAGCWASLCSGWPAAWFRQGCGQLAPLTFLHCGASRSCPFAWKRAPGPITGLRSWPAAAAKRV